MLVQYLHGDLSCEREAFLPTFKADYISRQGADEFPTSKKVRSNMNAALGRLKAYGLISLTPTTITLL